MKLSNSEKIILIVFLVVLIIGLGGWLLVYPAIQKIPTSQSNLDSAKAERDAVYASLAREDTIDEEIKQAMDKGKETQKYFYDDLSDYEADVIIRDILKETDMETNGLVINEFTTNELAVVDFVEVAVSYPLSEYANLGAVEEAVGTFDISDGISAEEKEAYLAYLSTMAQSVGATTISFEITGKKSDYIAFFDYVKDMEKATYIESCTIPYTLKANNSAVDENGNQISNATESVIKDNTEITSSITITLYSVKPIGEAEAAAE